MEKVLNQKELNNYVKNLKRHLKLTYTRQEADKISNYILKNANTFFEENPSASFSDFEHEFGSVDEIASSITETEWTKDFKRQSSLLHFRKKILKVCAAAFVLLSLLIGTLCIKIYWDAQKSIPAYSIDTITEESEPAADSSDNHER